MSDREQDGQITCPVCGQCDAMPLAEIDKVPIWCNVLFKSQEEALSVARGRISLHFCLRCAHTFNAAFDPAALGYDVGYENTLDHSARFREYVQALANMLIERYDLHGKDIVDIGCGQGAFLTLLCELGDNRGVGFDPSYDAMANVAPPTTRVTFIRDHYSMRYAHVPADLCISRQVLEHIARPISFLRDLRAAIGDRRQARVFFEVPNALFTLEDLSVWDIIYEHPSYFSHCSLSEAFSRAGFRVEDVWPTYEGQFLCIDAVPEADAGIQAICSDGELRRLRDIAAAFRRRRDEKIAHWGALLQELRAEGARAVVWGAGSKGVMFLNSLDTAGVIDYAVDINPRKQGMFVSGTGQRIVPPEFLVSYRPEVVILMNPVYQEEIGQSLDEMGLQTRIVVA
ncbi:MAG: class I SAM-dependent methyltransferase [Anaerolineae bacterium]